MRKLSQKNTHILMPAIHICLVLSRILIMARKWTNDRERISINGISYSTMKKKSLFTSFKGFATALCFSVLIISCNKTEDYHLPSDNGQMADLQVSSSFTFETAKDISVSIRTLDNTGAAVPAIRVSVYTDLPENGGKMILTGSTDNNGLFETDYKIPSGLDSLAVGTTAIGFCDMQKVSVSGGALNVTLGGKEGRRFKSSEALTSKTTVPNFFPLAPYNSQGVPSNLINPNDVIDAELIQDLNATLPESVSAPANRPEYFTETNEHNVVLTEACNIWVTFNHEGSFYKNSLGFYTYPAGNPPTSADAIDSIRIIFPNVSFTGSGGGLYAGNKVHLGIFPPGIEIGWVLVADAFVNGTITGGNWKLFSDKNLNPVSSPSLKQHTLLLNDLGRRKLILSFEDMKRDNPSDNDFNDVVFHVNIDPIRSVETGDLPLPDYTSPDSDTDGTSDNFDDYLTDPGMSFNNYYPAENSVGTLAFEDLWPSRGDYDFNDMVIDYNFNQVTNSQNKVIQIRATFIIKAFGASLNNGFGFQLPVSPSKIASVTGTDLHEDFIVLNQNGTEAGQSKATIIVFDNAFKQMPYPGGSSTGVNTTPGETYVEPKVLNVIITLTSPVSLSTMGTPPYNPFLIVDGDRSIEIHLINHPPTSLANTALFGTSSDDSNPSQGRYYVTDQNLPFAIDIAGPFDHPVEKSEITSAYLKFFQWGQSSGLQFYDWYVPKAGHRNSSKIYNTTQ